MSAIAWTPSQKRAIQTTGCSVLVSAGAGSGKTAVLAERCAYLVSDAHPPCGVDRLLVVTFTEAAAAEMKERIGEALRARLRARPADRRLQEQLALLDAASISTIHAFGRRTLERYFVEAGIDPGCPLLDDADARLLRRETAAAVFDRLAAADGPASEAFHNLLEAYSTVSDETMQDRVLEVSAFLESIPDPEEWIAQCLSRLAPAEDGGIPEYWRALLVSRLKSELAEQGRVVGDQLSEWRSDPPPHPGFAECLESHLRALQDWHDRLIGPDDSAVAASVDAICAVELPGYKFPSVPARRGKAYNGLDEDDQRRFSVAALRCRTIRDKLFGSRLKAGFQGFTLADWKQGIEAIRPHVETFFTVLRAFRSAYAEAKADLGVLDFADLERKTLELLRDESNGVARRLRDRFDHVLVDEYQDVNPIQAEILRLVSREGDPARPANLFAVGDVKQSIYRFRLAEPRLFLQRRGAFDVCSDSGGAPSAALPAGADASPRDSRPDRAFRGVSIDLRESFRSTKPLIAALNAVFSRVMAADLGGLDYDERSRLVHARRDDTSRAAPAVELHVLSPALPGGRVDAQGDERARNNASNDDDGESADDRNAEVSDSEAGFLGGDDAGGRPRERDAWDWERIEREAFVIARRIQGLVAEGWRYRDIVVLFRSLIGRGPLFVRALSRINVPVYADVAGGFFDSLEVLDVLSVLALVDNGQQDIPLAAVLRGPMLGTPLTDSELVEIRTADGARDLPFHEAVVAYARGGADAALRGKLAGVLARLAGWRARVRRRPLAETLWDIYVDSGYYAYVAGLPEGAIRRANLVALHERARQFDQFHRHGLHRFLRFLEDIRDADEDLAAGPPASAAADVVRIMTIHRSKGLEYPVVFLADAGKRFNFDDGAGMILFDRELGMGWEAVDVERRARYPTLPHRLVSQSVRREALAEELRVLYVALTRAKERLVLVGTGSIERIEQDRALYGRIEGPLPALVRHSARTMLDWLTPAIASQPSDAVSINQSAQLASKGPSSRTLFEVNVYSREEIGRWVMAPPPRTDVVARLDALGRIEPLEAFPPMDAADLAACSVPSAGFAAPQATEDSLVERIDRRLHAAYAAAALARVPAVVAASALKGRWDWSVDPEEAAAAGRFGFLARGRFDEPRFLERVRPADPVVLGTLTHAFLELLDLRGRLDPAGLEDQLRAATAAGRLPAEAARSIDLRPIAEFFTMEVGRRLTSPGARVFREWPFVLAVDPRRHDRAAAPLDRGDDMLVRGIIDCLFDAGGGWEILDYKTDDVAGPSVDERAAAYRGQLDIYAEAVRAAFGAAPARRCLVFLRSGRIVEV